MLEQIKKRQDELTSNFLIIKNQIADLEKQLEQKKEQLQKITGAIMEFDVLIKLAEDKEKEKEIQKENK